jgi:hypothetical protein
MCRHACVSVLFLSLATASASWASPRQPPTFHPVMGLYDGDGVSGDRVVGEATAFDRSPSDRSPGRPRPRFLVSWANIADELGAGRATSLL